MMGNYFKVLSMASSVLLSMTSCDGPFLLVGGMVLANDEKLILYMSALPGKPYTLMETTI